MNWLTFSIMFALLCTSAFFAASETALTGASRASMLRLSKQGNSEADVVSSLFDMRERLIGGLLLAAIGCLIWFFITALTGALFAALICALLTVPTSSIFNCHAGWPRWTMAAVAVGLAGVGWFTFADSRRRD